MTTVQPTPPAAETDQSFAAFPPELRDVCLRIQLAAVPSDEELERINRENPGWKLELGAQLGWLVDPLEGTVWIGRPDEATEMLRRPTELSGESVLEGLRVDMTEVWSLVDEAAEDESTG